MSARRPAWYSASVSERAASTPAGSASWLRDTTIESRRGGALPPTSGDSHVRRPMMIAFCLPAGASLVSDRRCARSPLSRGHGRASSRPMPQP